MTEQDKKEIITSIKETTWEYNEWEYEGFVIETNKQIIKIGISTYQSCCETAGYLSTPDELDTYVGAVLNKIELADKSLDNNRAILGVVGDLEDGGAEYVNIHTDKGLFQLTVYNAHNGFYLHGTVVISKELNHEGCL